MNETIARACGRLALRLDISAQDQGLERMQCNVCGAHEWGNQGSRKDVRCLNCNSLERTRVIKLYLDRLGLPRSDQPVLHIAPEKGLGTYLRDRVGRAYRGIDLHPELFPFLGVERCDLCAQAEQLPSNTYGLIIHSHVLEHLPCNWTAVLLHLHRALALDGYHIFSLPIMDGAYDETLANLTAADATARFGQADHVRRIARSDIDRTLGMVFKGDLRTHTIGAQFDEATLTGANIPRSEWAGLNGSTVFVMNKSSCRFDMFV